MTLWLIRAGSRGEHEQKFLDEGKVYVAWDGLNVDLMQLADRQALIQAMEQRYPDEKPKALINWSSQVWSFGREMAAGDWVVMPSKIQSGLYFGELKGSYNYAASGPDPYFHWREIDWFSGLIPRSVFPQDLLYSFGAFLTICKVQRKDAEVRVRAMAARHWQPEGISAIGARPTADPVAVVTADEAEVNNVDLEELAADRIVRLIEARFKGHGLAELGFGKPQICVEVKSGSDPVDRPTVDKLIGAGQKFGAETCLFVSWGGFKPNVQKELARDFFRVRLWSRKELLEKLFDHYAQLPEEIRLALPLKRVWMVAEQED
jgi:restriction system protein